MLNWRAVADAAISGHGAQQSPGEFAMFLSAAAALCPAAVIEVGTADGGTTWALSHLPGVRTLVTIDAVDHPAADWLLAVAGSPVRRIVGESAAPGTLAGVRRLLPGGADLVLIDADHTYEGAVADWRAYEPMVRAGGMLVFHDIAWPESPVLQVARVWKEVRGEHQGRVTELVDEPGHMGTGIAWL